MQKCKNKQYKYIFNEINIMKIYFNGWFSGFDDKTNPGLHIDFFLSLFEKVYG